MYVYIYIYIERERDRYTSTSVDSTVPRLLIDVDSRSRQHCINSTDNNTKAVDNYSTNYPEQGFLLYISLPLSLSLYIYIYIHMYIHIYI